MPPVARGRASAEQGARGPWVWLVPPVHVVSVPAVVPPSRAPLTGTERRAREPPPSRLRGKSGRGTHLDPRPELAGPDGRPAPLARGHPRPAVSPHACPGRPVPSDMASSPGGG